MVTNESDRVTAATAITAGEVYRQAREQAAQEDNYDVQGGLDRFSAWMRGESTEDDSSSWDSSAKTPKARSQSGGVDTASYGISSGKQPHPGAKSAHAGHRDTGGISRQAAALRAAIRPVQKARHPQYQGPQRQAQLTLARVEPWSVMKISFVVSTAATVVLLATAGLLYPISSSLGVFAALQHTITALTSTKTHAGISASSWFSPSRVLGYIGLLGALNIVLITAASTIGAVIYNLISQAIDGIEVTLRETDRPGSTKDKLRLHL